MGAEKGGGGSTEAVVEENKETTDTRQQGTRPTSRYAASSLKHTATTLCVLFVICIACSIPLGGAPWSANTTAVPFLACSSFRFFSFPFLFRVLFFSFFSFLFCYFLFCLFFYFISFFPIDLSLTCVCVVIGTTFFFFFFFFFTWHVLVFSGWQTVCTVGVFRRE